MNATIPCSASVGLAPAGNGPVPANRHDDFLALAPVVERHARVVFRGWPESHREEAVAEAVAAAFESYVRLKQAGRDPVREFPSRMAVFAALHVKEDRHVGSRASSKDVLSHRAQRKHGFVVEALPSCFQRNSHELYGTPDGQEQLDTIEEQLHDNTLTPVPDQVAFRLDLADFVASLEPRDRRLVRFLALGHSGQEAARRFRVCPGRISQLRNRWAQEWRARQGEDGFSIRRLGRGRPRCRARCRS